MRKSEYQKIKEVIEKLLNEYSDGDKTFWGDLVFKTPEEHSAVHPYLEGSKLVMWCDGSPMYGMLQGEFGWNFQTKLIEALEKIGYYYEQGHAWNLGVYKS